MEVEGSGRDLNCRKSVAALKLDEKGTMDDGNGYVTVICRVRECHCLPTAHASASAAES